MFRLSRGFVSKLAPKWATFVATGPSAPMSTGVRRRGDLVTFNLAVSLFRTGVRLAFFGTPGKLFDARLRLGGVKRVVCLFSPEFVEPCSLDNYKGAVTYTRVNEVREHKDLSGQQAVALANDVWRGRQLGRVPLAFYYLHRAGYTDLWCFGVDGGPRRCEKFGLNPSQRGYNKSLYLSVLAALKYKLGMITWPDVPDD